MTKCGHSFHGECLGNWFDRNAKCPLCLSESFNPIVLFCKNCNYRIFGMIIGKNPGKNG